MPSAATELRILELAEREELELVPVTPVLSINDLIAARKAVAAVHVSAALKDYIIRLVAATRSEDYTGVIEHPISPRGSLALAAAVRARAFLRDRDHALPEDVSALARDTLTHRLGLTWRAVAEGKTAASVLEEIINATEVI